MKKELKGFVCGVVATTLVAGGAAFAAGQWKTIDVIENDITVMVDGKQVTESNFVYNDRTYLPLRAVAEAVGKPVYYDESTNMAYIGNKSTSTQINTSLPTTQPSSTAGPNKLSDAEYNSKKAELDKKLTKAFDEIDNDLERNLEYLENEKERYDTSSLEKQLSELEEQAQMYSNAVTITGKSKYESILDNIDRVESQIKNIEINIRQIENQQDSLREQAKKDKQAIQGQYDKALAELEQKR